MIGYIEFLGVPATVGIVIVAAFLIMQIVGELLEFKGKVVPEFVKIRKRFQRKKRERQMLQEMSETIKEVKVTLAEVNSHYNADNIKMRDEWIKKVNCKLEQNDEFIQELAEKLDKNNHNTLDILINTKRDTIINFAAYVIDEKNLVTREQFHRIFKLHNEYEEILKTNNLTNGETDIAIRIITESYETHMRTHSFVEDVRGYSLSEHN